jgi:acetate---CoA ligase (ADP-forming)
MADAMQGKGLGTILLGQLAEVAGRAGITVLSAEVLPQNHRMVQVFHDSGFPVRTHGVPGALLFEVSTSLTPEGLERFERREQLAAVAAMRVRADVPGPPGARAAVADGPDLWHLPGQPPDRLGQGL